MGLERGGGETFPRKNTRRVGLATTAVTWRICFGRRIDPTLMGRCRPGGEKRAIPSDERARFAIRPPARLDDRAGRRYAGGRL
jgi:hypothetical protein